MKKYTIFAAFCLLILHSGCQKDPENQIFVSEAQIANFVAGNISRDAKGLFSELDAATFWVQRGLSDAAPCNYVKDSTFSQSNPTAALYTYSFAQSYHTDIQCTNAIPVLVHFGLTHNGLWDTAKAKAKAANSHISPVAVS